MNSPPYLQKYRSSPASETRSGESAFLQYLETLNAADWQDLLTDCICGAPDAVRVFMPDRGQEPLAYSSTFLKRLGIPTQQIAGTALSRILTVGLLEEKMQLLHGAIFLSAFLPGTVMARPLMDLFGNRNAPEEFRKDALRALASHAAEIPVTYWQQVDLEHDPTLVPIVTAALSEVAPHEALARLAGLKSPPDDTAALENPLCVAIEKIATRDGVSRIADIAEASPAWLRGCLDRVMHFPEFAGILNAWTTALGKHFEPPRTDVAESMPQPPYRVDNLIQRISATLAFIELLKDSHSDNNIAVDAFNRMIRAAIEMGEIAHNIESIDVKADAAATRAVRQRRTSSLNTAAKTILFVDDEPFSRTFLAELLEQEGYRVIQASNPSEALTVFGKSEPAIHLLLSDMAMPYGNHGFQEDAGLKLAAAIRSRRGDTKIIFLMAGAQHQDLMDAAKNFGPVLAKPTAKSVLLEAVKSSLSGTKATARE
jgi:CheY-like chemotaxis protein